MAIRQDPPPFGECCVCELRARLWCFDEEVVPLGAGLGFVQADGICRMCLKVLVREANQGDEGEPLRNA
jgi:hypothetical protein